MGQIEVFGASPEVPVDPLADIPARLALLIADLADHECALLLRRADSLAHFSSDDAQMLYRTQRIRSALEEAMGLAE
ncbi:hypothetical protein EKD04_001665 [Chloroflexales bacterium ZM16-3]|nr:hypothetical protein [Chloroflexales bacterium ZM16-3]